MYKIMSAEEIKSLSHLPIEVQEEFLRILSADGNEDRFVNIEIDGLIYTIPMVVSHLIDSLVNQLNVIGNNKGS